MRDLIKWSRRFHGMYVSMTKRSRNFEIFIFTGIIQNTLFSAGLVKMVFNYYVDYLKRLVLIR